MEKAKCMHILEFPIYQVDGYRHPRDGFEKPFRILHHIHNVLVKEGQRRLDRLYRDKSYRKFIRDYHRADIKSKKEISKDLKELTKKYGVGGNYCLDKYVSVQQKIYSKYISSLQAQKEAQRVYRGIEQVLYCGGKKLHLKRYTQIKSVSQKNATNGIKFDIHTGIGHWGKYTFRCKIDWSDEYKAQSLATCDIAYYEIKRRMFDSGWRYYLLIFFKGPAPKKITDAERLKHKQSTGGLDIGTSTIAFVTDEECMLERLAPNAIYYEKEIRKLNKEIDRIVRINNPHKFDSKGVIRKEIKFNKESNKIKALRRKVKTLYRKKVNIQKRTMSI